MGLFDSLKGTFEQVALDEFQTALPAALAKTNLGDMQGVVTQLQQSGLGSQVQSWMNGGSVSVTPQQIESALGSDQVKQIAQHFGVDPSSALNVLAQHLPSMVAQSK
ncbi:MAG: DUF937 domain-containing protein [Bradyrhizobium sp.]|nr:MAG: DUF937 domain-containing protein [Bradyrhizobium sp.]